MTKVTDDLHANVEAQETPIQEKVKAPRKKRQKRLQLEFTPEEYACVSSSVAFAQILDKKTGVITPAERGEILASICKQWIDIARAKHLIQTHEEPPTVVTGDSTVEPTVTDSTGSDEPADPENDEEGNLDNPF